MSIYLADLTHLFLSAPCTEKQKGLIFRITQFQLFEMRFDNYIIQILC